VKNVKKIYDRLCLWRLEVKLKEMKINWAIEIIRHFPDSPPVNRPVSTQIGRELALPVPRVPRGC